MMSSTSTNAANSSSQTGAVSPPCRRTTLPQARKPPGTHRGCGGSAGDAALSATTSAENWSPSDLPAKEPWRPRKRCWWRVAEGAGVQRAGAEPSFLQWDPPSGLEAAKKNCDIGRRPVMTAWDSAWPQTAGAAGCEWYRP
ncbi:hypothetical protein NDU88_003147 [Pleurodeles waltl]|uniref:Uncharacterized protein n=1 Tax=Pleurodeles waltl TaxID=8319 RepID=A0AAV7LG96_PLEWA|nr:hypothetical protein NDU88_003147 [Pleurodeles waltl]